MILDSIIGDLKKRWTVASRGMRLCLCTSCEKENMDRVIANKYSLTTTSNQCSPSYTHEIRNQISARKGRECAGTDIDMSGAWLLVVHSNAEVDLSHVDHNSMNQELEN